MGKAEEPVDIVCMAIIEAPKGLYLKGFYKLQDQDFLHE